MGVNLLWLAPGFVKGGGAPQQIELGQQADGPGERRHLGFPWKA